MTLARLCFGILYPLLFYIYRNVSLRMINIAVIENNFIYPVKEIVQFQHLPLTLFASVYMVGNQALVKYWQGMGPQRYSTIGPTALVHGRPNSDITSIVSLLAHFYIQW